MQQKIVLIGGPGTGKSTLLNELIKRAYKCMPEISREVILQAQEKGIEQLFLTDPLLFSEMLLERRIKQHVDATASKDKIVFFDRGIPDVHAYLDFTKTPYPSIYKEKSEAHKYSKIFLLPPWEEIYLSDNERYESFEEAVLLFSHLKETYLDLGYTLITVPFGSVEDRTNFILHSLKSDI